MTAAIAAVLYSPELDARILVGLDRRCIFSLMEVLLGGDAQEPPFDDDRNFSTLEVRVAQTVFEIAAEALQFRLRAGDRHDIPAGARRNAHGLHHHGPPQRAGGDRQDPHPGAWTSAARCSSSSRNRR